MKPGSYLVENMCNLYPYIVEHVGVSWVVYQGDKRSVNHLTPYHARGPVAIRVPAAWGKKIVRTLAGSAVYNWLKGQHEPG